jgi:hypothetical protein
MNDHIIQRSKNDIQAANVQLIQLANVHLDIYSLLGSAKFNGLDPELYLHKVLERIPGHPISRISDLLPWTFAVAKT